MRQLAWLGAGLGLALLLWRAQPDRTHAEAVKLQLAAIERRPAGAEIACAGLAAQRPVVLLVLGQSNAANHGALSVPQPAIATFFRGRCFASREPLPGGSGEGASLWPRVAANLGGQLHGRPLLFAQLAVESTTIADWTSAGPLRDALGGELRALARGGFPVAAVLWQQGEADAKARTSEQAYRQGLAELLRWLGANGIHAPFVAALSTYCPRSDGAMVRAAVHQFARHGNEVVIGPDTDSLKGAMRSGDCHFSEAGLKAGAAQWAATLRALR